MSSSVNSEFGTCRARPFQARLTHGAYRLRSCGQGQAGRLRSPKFSALETALFVGEGAGKRGDNVFFRDGFEAEKVRAGKQRRDNVKARIVRRAPDDADISRFDVGKQQILLRLVKAVNFVDEQQRAPSRIRACHAQNIAQFRRVGKHGIDADAMAMRDGSNDFREGRFPQPAVRKRADFRNCPLQSGAAEACLFRGFFHDRKFRPNCGAHACRKRSAKSARLRFRFPGFVVFASCKKRICKIFSH